MAKRIAPIFALVVWAAALLSSVIHDGWRGIFPGVFIGTLVAAVAFALVFLIELLVNSGRED
jgi:hypothetical protein